MARYKQLLFYAAKLPAMSAEQHKPENKVEGCVSQVGQAAGEGGGCPWANVAVGVGLYVGVVVSTAEAATILHASIHTTQHCGVLCHGWVKRCGSGESTRAEGEAPARLIGCGGGWRWRWRWWGCA
jgi:hypothetical protein